MKYLHIVFNNTWYRPILLTMAVTIAIAAATLSNAQSVGIGTNTPDLAYKLDVVGSAKISTNLSVLNRIGIGGAGSPSYKLYVENGSSYFDGSTTTIGSATVNGNANIGGTVNIAGATIIDNNFRVNGRTGIGGATDANYQLIVHGGNSYFEGNSITTGNASIGGTATITGATTIDNNFRVNGRAGIGGSTSASYQLIVRNGNSYFEDNATVAGTLNAVGDLTIKGNGHVRSNGSSNLKVGFDQVSVNTGINPNSYVDVTANITAFSNGNSDIRVSVCQVAAGVGSSAGWHYLTYVPFAVDATNDTCKIRIVNQTGSGIVLQGTIYLMSIAKD